MLSIYWLSTIENVWKSFDIYNMGKYNLCSQDNDLLFFAIGVESIPTWLNVISCVIFIALKKNVNLTNFFCCKLSLKPLFILPSPIFPVHTLYKNRTVHLKYLTTTERTKAAVVWNHFSSFHPFIPHLPSSHSLQKQNRTFKIPYDNWENQSSCSLSLSSFY